jgi:hypothetical protein
VREVIAAQGIKVYCPPIDEEDDNAAEHARQTQAVMPFSIIGSTNDVVTADGRTVKGREYLWGTAEGAYYPSDWCKRASATIGADTQSRTRSTAISKSCAASSSAHTCST